MKNRCCFIAVCVACTLINRASAEPPVATPTRLSLHLVDGSHLVATTTLTSLKMRTSLADLNVPVSEILKMELSAEPGRSAVVLRNGDRLSGDLEFDKFPVQSLLGKGSLDVKHIEKVVFFAAFHAIHTASSIEEA